MTREASDRYRGMKKHSRAIICDEDLRVSNIDVSSTAFRAAVNSIIMYSRFCLRDNFFVASLYLFTRILFALHHILSIACVRVQSSYTRRSRTWAILYVRTVFVFVLPLRRWCMKMHASMKANPL